MYFWNINALKAEMIKGEFTEKQSIFYILWSVALYAMAVEIIGYLPFIESNIWTHVDTIVCIIIPTLGTWYMYKKNGGEEGSDFATKYFAIGLVVGIRFLVYLIPIILLLIPFLSEDGSLTFLEVFVASLWYVLLYYKMGKHIEDIRHALAQLPPAVPVNKPVSKWVYIFVLPLVVIFLGLLAIGIMAENGVLFPGTVQEGKEVTSQNKELLLSHDIISRGEVIEYFYSEGFTSILDGGSLLMNDRLIGYIQNKNEEVDVYELYYKDIVSIKLLEEGSTFSDSIYKVYGKGKDNWIELFLSTDKKGDLKFIEALESKIK